MSSADVRKGPGLGPGARFGAGGCNKVANKTGTQLVKLDRGHDPISSLINENNLLLPGFNLLKKKMCLQLYWRKKCDVSLYTLMFTPCVKNPSMVLNRARGFVGSWTIRQHDVSKTARYASSEVECCGDGRKETIAQHSK